MPTAARPPSSGLKVLRYLDPKEPTVLGFLSMSFLYESLKGSFFRVEVLLCSAYGIDLHLVLLFEQWIRRLATCGVLVIP